MHPLHCPERSRDGAGRLRAPLVGGTVCTGPPTMLPIVLRRRTSKCPGPGGEPVPPGPPAGAADRSPQADEQMLRAAAAGPSALGPLYDRYAKLVYGLALAILGSRRSEEHTS